MDHLDELYAQTITFFARLSRALKKRGLLWSLCKDPT